MNRAVSMRWLVAVVAGVVVGMFALTGTAAAPPAGAPVRIVDADNADQVAHVDADGNLQVGGTLGIDSSTPIATTDASARQSFQERLVANIPGGQFAGQASFTVPTGKRLIIQFVSAGWVVAAGDRIGQVTVDTETDGVVATHHFAAVFTGPRAGGDTWSVSQDTSLYADGAAATCN
jgi:hypothetical protein